MERKGVIGEKGAKGRQRGEGLGETHRAIGADGERQVGHPIAQRRGIIDAQQQIFAVAQLQGEFDVVDDGLRGRRRAAKLGDGENLGTGRKGRRDLGIGTRYGAGAGRIHDAERGSYHTDTRQIGLLGDGFNESAQARGNWQSRKSLQR